MNVYCKILLGAQCYLLLSNCNFQNPLNANSTSHLDVCSRIVLSELPYMKDLYIYYYPPYLSPKEKLLLATYWDQFLVLLHLDEMQEKTGSLSYQKKFLKDPWKANSFSCNKNSAEDVCEEEDFLPTSSALILELLRYPQQLMKLDIDPFFSAEYSLYWMRLLLKNDSSGSENLSRIQAIGMKFEDKYPTYPILLEEIPGEFFISAFAWAFFSQFILIQNEARELVYEIRNLYQKYQDFPFLSNVRGGAVDKLMIHAKAHSSVVFYNSSSDEQCSGIEEMTDLIP